MKSLRKKRHSLVIFGSEKDKIQQEFGSPPTSPQGAKNSEKDNKKQSGKSVSLLPPTPPDSPMHQVPHHLISPRFIKDEAKRKKQKIDRRQTVGEGPSGPSGTSVNILTPPRSRNRKKRLSQLGRVPWSEETPLDEPKEKKETPSAGSSVPQRVTIFVGAKDQHHTHGERMSRNRSNSLGSYMHPLPPLSTTLQLQEGENFAEMQRGDEQEKGLIPPSFVKQLLRKNNYEIPYQLLRIATLHREQLPNFDLMFHLTDTFHLFHRLMREEKKTTKELHVLIRNDCPTVTYFMGLLQPSRPKWSSEVQNLIQKYPNERTKRSKQKAKATPLFLADIVESVLELFDIVLSHDLLCAIGALALISLSESEDLETAINHQTTWIMEFTSTPETLRSFPPIQPEIRSSLTSPWNPERLPGHRDESEKEESDHPNPNSLFSTKQKKNISPLSCSLPDLKSPASDPAVKLNSSGPDVDSQILKSKGTNELNGFPFFEESKLPLGSSEEPTLNFEEFLCLSESQSPHPAPNPNPRKLSLTKPPVKYFLEQNIPATARPVENAKSGFRISVSPGSHVAPPPNSPSMKQFFVFYEPSGSNNPTKKDKLRRISNAVKSPARISADKSRKKGDTDCPEKRNPLSDEEMREAIQSQEELALSFILTIPIQRIEKKEAKRWWTLLHVAAKSGSLRVIDALLQRKPNVWVSAKGGCLALHLFCSRQFSAEDDEELIGKIMERLCPYSCLANYPNAERETPLHYAMMKVRSICPQVIRILSFLIQKGANPKVATRRGLTPLDYLRQCGSPELYSVIEGAMNQWQNRFTISKSTGPLSQDASSGQPSSSSLFDGHLCGSVYYGNRPNLLERSEPNIRIFLVGHKEDDGNFCLLNSPSNEEEEKADQYRDEPSDQYRDLQLTSLILGTSPFSITSNHLPFSETNQTVCERAEWKQERGCKGDRRFFDQYILFDEQRFDSLFARYFSKTPHHIYLSFDGSHQPLFLITEILIGSTRVKGGVSLYMVSCSPLKSATWPEQWITLKKGSSWATVGNFVKALEKELSYLDLVSLPLRSPPILVHSSHPSTNVTVENDFRFTPSPPLSSPIFSGPRASPSLPELPSLLSFKGSTEISPTHSPQLTVLASPKSAVTASPILRKRTNPKSPRFISPRSKSPLPARQFAPSPRPTPLPLSSDGSGEMKTESPVQSDCSNPELLSSLLDYENFIHPKNHRVCILRAGQSQQNYQEFLNNETTQPFKSFLNCFAFLSSQVPEPSSLSLSQLRSGPPEWSTSFPEGAPSRSSSFQLGFNQISVSFDILPHTRSESARNEIAHSSVLYLIFNESNLPLNLSSFPSISTAIIAVAPLRDTSPTQYNVEVTFRGIKPTEPSLPYPPHFFDKGEFSKFLLCKIINLHRAILYHPVFSTHVQALRTGILNEIAATTQPPEKENLLSQDRRWALTSTIILRELMPLFVKEKVGVGSANPQSGVAECFKRYSFGQLIGKMILKLCSGEKFTQEEFLVLNDPLEFLGPCFALFCRNYFAQGLVLIKKHFSLFPSHLNKLEDFTKFQAALQFAQTQKTSLQNAPESFWSSIEQLSKDLSDFCSEQKEIQR